CHRQANAIDIAAEVPYPGLRQRRAFKTDRARDVMHRGNSHALKLCGTKTCNGFWGCLLNRISINQPGLSDASGEFVGTHASSTRTNELRHGTRVFTEMGAQLVHIRHGGSFTQLQCRGDRCDTLLIVREEL